MSGRVRYSLSVLFSRLKRPGFIRYALLIMGPLVLALVGAYYYAIGGQYVSTENAYVKADKIAISTDVSGRVSKVNVEENQLVKKGDVLFELDQEPFQIALDKAEADVHQIRNEIETNRKLFAEKEKDLERAREDVAFFQREFDRRQKLLKRGVVSQNRFDSAASNLERTRSRADGVREELAQLMARLGGSPEKAAELHPEVLAAEAKRDEAKLDLDRTVIRAPETGIVTKNDLQVGEFVTRGRPVFSVVGWDEIWIEANLKETELTHVNEGQMAEITVDAYPDVVWKARVSSIAPATGAEFSILPPQNATGNWVKVVQRVPVRLEIDDEQAGPPLRAGMSVIVTIDTQHQRDLPPIVARAVALIKGNQ
ncbi:MAG: HlyD family secretion protein [Alphaproteobacteria bacterium]|nr:HlyD family secretion protein [Alphaproteobacteria bacterium]